MNNSISQYTENETILLDNLADGQWHPLTKIVTQVTGSGSGTKLTKRTIQTTLKGLAKRNVLLEGANDSYRFITDELELWRVMSPTLDRNNVQMKPRYFGGILEDDGWCYAPLQECHLVHFKASGKLTKTKIAELVNEDPSVVFLNEDGLFKIYSATRTATYDRVKVLKEEHPEYMISGIRLESNLRRRNIHALPKRYLDDMCRHYGQFAKVLLRGQMSSIKKHLPDEDDAQQQIYLWVIEAIKRYDDSTSIPFAAFLGTNIRKWVYDLNRKAYGRSIADKELKHARAANEFRIKHERYPTVEELADLLGDSVDEVAKDKEAISTVVNLRNQRAIEYDDYEVPLPSHEQTDFHLENLIENTILSSAITTASKHDSKRRNIAGLVALYYTTWGVDVDNKRIKSWLRSKATQQALTDIQVKASKIVNETRNRDL